MNNLVFNINFLKRVLSSLFLIFIAFLSLLSNNYILISVLLILICILTYEWVNITENVNNKIIIFTRSLINIFIFLLSLFNIMWSVLFILLITIINITSKNHPKVKSLYIHFGPFYICFPLIFLYSLNLEIVNGHLIVIWCLLVVWFTDTFAYIGGSIFKGKKLFPKISPNKTFSGAISGLLGGILISILTFMYLEYDILNSILLGLLVSIVAQIGDFFESYIKRIHFIKDSSNLIPGHGGMLDRLDSSLPVFCFVFIVYKLFV